MNDLLILPGNSPRHATWVEDLKAALTPNFETIIAQHYRHWQSGAEQADVEYEITTAKQAIQYLESYTIVAKSIGTVIATRATAEGIIFPEKLVLLGAPLNGGAPNELFRQWLTAITIPVVIIQNTADPLGVFHDVVQAFDGAGEHISFIETPGNTHDYLDFALIGNYAVLSPPIK